MVVSGISSGVWVNVIVRMIMFFCVFSLLEVSFSKIGNFIINIVLVLVVMIEWVVFFRNVVVVLGVIKWVVVCVGGEVINMISQVIEFVMVVQMNLISCYLIMNMVVVIIIWMIVLVIISVLYWVYWLVLVSMFSRVVCR